MSGGIVKDLCCSVQPGELKVSLLRTKNKFHNSVVFRHVAFYNNDLQRQETGKYVFMIIEGV